MNIIGMNTAINEMLIESTVKRTSAVPAQRGLGPETGPRCIW